MALVAAGGVVGALLMRAWMQPREMEPKAVDPHEEARARVWQAIGGAMTSAQVYLGDKLSLYVTLAKLCRETHKRPELRDELGPAQILARFGGVVGRGVDVATGEQSRVRREHPS